MKDGSVAEVDCSGRDERELPHTFIDYVENPREYNLSAVNTVLDVHTRVSDLYSKPYNQISEQLRLTWKYDQFTFLTLLNTKSIEPDSQVFNTHQLRIHSKKEIWDKNDVSIW